MPGHSVVAVEIDFFDRVAGVPRTLPLANVEGLAAPLGGQRRLYEPALLTPFTIGHSIDPGLGNAVRATPNRGRIEFAAADRIRPYLGHAVLGRPCRVYVGNDPDYSTLTLAYEGQVGDLTYDAVTLRAAIEVTDAKAALDEPLIDDLYEAADGVDPSLTGLPKPQLWGTGHSLEPQLENDPLNIYRVSRELLNEVLQLRGGGVPWDRVTTSPSRPGQWRHDPVDSGLVQLGGPLLGDELRVDARAGSYTTAGLFRAIVEAAGLEVDDAGMVALYAAAPYLVGYYAREPINRQTALDDIMLAAGGWWGGTQGGRRLTAGLWAAPEGMPAVTYSESQIVSLRLVARLSPAWRVRVERNRNWQPANQFRTSVTEAQQAAMRAGGIVCPEFRTDETTRTVEPRALDVPLIRTLVNDEADAYAIRDRLWAAWGGVSRSLWQIEVSDDPPPLMTLVAFQFEGIGGLCRVTSARRSFGGGVTEMVLWG